MFLISRAGGIASMMGFPGCSFRRAVFVCFALAVLLQMCFWQRPWAASTTVNFVAHVGSGAEVVCSALKQAFQSTCARSAGCPLFVCRAEDERSRDFEPSTESSSNVLLLRDPRDIARSVKEDCLGENDCAMRHIRSVSSWTASRYHEYSRNLGNRISHHVVIFEELVASPQVLVNALRDSLAGQMTIQQEATTRQLLKTAMNTIQTCQATSAYPSWIAIYASSVMEEELPPALARRWTLSCNTSWTPDQCHRKAKLEKHGAVRTHGDICRWKGGDFSCPPTCKLVDGAPHCQLDNQPCRVKRTIHRWQAGFVPNLLTRRVMHTFYEPAWHDYRARLTNLTLASWARHWQRAGWHTRILTLADAQKSPHYDELLTKLSRLSLGSNGFYETLCFLRYLAVSEAGGGWMSDYDTLPMQFLGSSHLMEHGRFTVLQGHIPALMSGSKEEWLRMARLLVSRAENMTHGRNRSVSDMFALEDLLSTTADAFMSMNVVADAQSYVLPTASCDDFRSFSMAMHVSHESLLAKFAGDRRAIEENRPRVMDELADQFWKCWASSE